MYLERGDTRNNDALGDYSYDKMRFFKDPYNTEAWHGYGRNDGA
jgi:hypothetical protein